MVKISILGAGAFGTALGDILVDNGYDIEYYDPRVFDNSLSEVIEGANYILIAVPSESVFNVLPLLPNNIPLIIATKGIISVDSFSRFDDYMILSGPGFASDIEAKKKTYLTATDKRIFKLFKTDFLKFDYTDDKNGVLLCGTLKNVYAIYAGMLRLKKNEARWVEYIDRVVDEMKIILDANGANSKTVDLACGVGDLKLTCAYPSRNFEFGDKLRDNPDYKPTKTVEGVSALKKIKRGEIVVPRDAVLLRELMKVSEKWA